MKILINTEHDDIHEKVIKKALMNRGHEVDTMLGDNFPEKTSFTFISTSEDIETYYTDEASRTKMSQYDVIWHRRPVLYKLPPTIPSEDIQFAANENNAMAYAWMACQQSAFWINNPFSKARALSKPLQLKLALSNNLKIPKTLISNNPTDIKDFVSNNKDVIYKPLTGFVWNEENKKTMTYTSRVKTEDLPKDNILRLAPGIFQTLINKKFEVRAQFFGHSCFAIAIETEKLEYGGLDYRRDPNKPSCSQIQLPKNVFQACISIMSDLGIVSGGFDFMVTKKDAWIFLEVNEAGQFLFIEGLCKELNLTTAFCDFIESKNHKFIFNNKNISCEKLDILIKDE